MEVCPTDVIFAPAEHVWRLLTNPHELAMVRTKLVEGPARAVGAGDRLVFSSRTIAHHLRRARHASPAAAHARHCAALWRHESRADSDHTHRRPLVSHDVQLSVQLPARSAGSAPEDGLWPAVRHRARRLARALETDRRTASNPVQMKGDASNQTFGQPQDQRAFRLALTDNRRRGDARDQRLHADMARTIRP